jgi:thiol-disulfide isomerase/thioredoxin
MKTNIIKIFFILSLCSCSNYDLKVFEGKSFHLEDLKGKWIIFNYWADWCPPCIKEIPELNNLDKNFSKDLKVFLINFDLLEGEELKQQLERFNVSVDSLLSDPSEIFKWVVPENLPVTFIVNKEGELEHTLIGPQTEKEIIDLLLL